VERRGSLGRRGRGLTRRREDAKGLGGNAVSKGGEWRVASGERFGKCCNLKVGRSLGRRGNGSHAKTRRRERRLGKGKSWGISFFFWLWQVQGLGGSYLGAHAKTRRRERVGGKVPQLPKKFWGNEGVLECSGLTELWMGRERVEGENPKRCQATAVQERRMRNLTRRREGAKGLGWVLRWSGLLEALTPWGGGR
jgi:hypothetical protein